MRYTTKVGAALTATTVAAVAAWAAVSLTGTASATDATGQVTAESVTAAGGTWGQPLQVPGLAALAPSGDTLVGASISAITCTTPGNCSAVGSWEATGNGTVIDWPFTVTETAGTWGYAQQVSGVTTLGDGKTASLQLVSCGAPGDCTAAGTFGSTETRENAFLVTESAGTWGAATAVNDAGLGTGLWTEVNALSCPAADDCAASFS